MHPGSWAQLAWIVAIALLGASGLAARGPARKPEAQTEAAAAEQPLTTVIGLMAAGAAAAVSLIFAGLTWGHSGTLPVVLGGALALVLVARIGGLLRQAAASSALAEQAGSQFDQLADRTSDVVLLCDEAGLISYASTAVSRYGYAPDQLADAALPDLIHPDDVASVTGAAQSVLSDAAAPARNLACRVRAADGTWRHVQATVSRFRQGDEPDLLLVTATDVSDQLALRQQVTHLTFHDGLTGLPNRSYLEERTKDLLARHRQMPDPSAGADSQADRGHLRRPGRLHRDQRLRRARRRRPGTGPGWPQTARHRACSRYGRPVGRRRVRGPDRGRVQPAGDRRHRRAAGWRDRRRPVPGGRPGLVDHGEPWRGVRRPGCGRALAAQRRPGHVQG